MGSRTRSFLAVVATIVGSFALVRLADAVGKRELVRAALEADAEAQVVAGRYDSLQMVKSKLEQDTQYLSYRIASLSRREPYLVINRAERTLTLAVQDKTILETQYQFEAQVEDYQFYRLKSLAAQPIGSMKKASSLCPDPYIAFSCDSCIIG